MIESSIIPASGINPEQYLAVSIRDLVRYQNIEREAGEMLRTIHEYVRVGSTKDIEIRYHNREVAGIFFTAIMSLHNALITH